MSEVSKLTAWFRSQVGTREVGENNVVYNTHYYGGEVSGSQYPWCCAFIWDGFRQTGLSRLFCGGAKTAFCPYVADYARSHGQWVTGGYREGDILLYDWDGDGKADHIGYVISWSGGSGKVIEGNTSDAVAIMTRSSTSVMGAYRPAYSGGDTPQPDTPAQTAPEVVDGIYTAQKGDTLWGIAAKLLGGGDKYREIQKLNGLTSTLIYVGQRLKIPGQYKETEDKSTAKPAEAAENVSEHIVVLGDTLWGIAQKYLGKGTRYKEIMTANGLKNETIYPGQRLKIPER